MSGRSTVEVLKAARKRIEDPERWCQVAFHEGPPWRQRHCAMGAIAVSSYGLFRRHPDLSKRAQDTLRDAARDLYGWPSLILLNDHGSPAVCHPRVLAAFDRAIELAESESQKEGERV